MTDPAHELPSVNYAGFWRRAGAYLIDAVILSAVTQILSVVTGIDGNPPPNVVPTPEEILMTFIYIAIAWLYFALLESSSKQATVGKMAIGLIVTDEDGKRVSFARATGRFFAKIISAIILLIGYLMVIWTKKRQGLHDMMARTLVLRK
jgi:uncharacterized RDD family membrane protein YckC